MRVSILSFRSEILLRGAALGLIASMSAGCSSDFTRFAPTSNDYTGSINQQQIIFKNQPLAKQAFPDVAPVEASTVDNQSSLDEPVYTGSVQSDGSIRPVVSSTKSAVQRSVLSPVTVAAQKLPAPTSPARSIVTPQVFPTDTPAAKPLQAAASAKVAAKSKSLVEPIDQVVTGAVQKAVPSSVMKVAAVEVSEAASATVKPIVPEGWSKTGAATINVRDGDTILGLARRHGVPANAILGVNGLSSGSTLKSGQRLIIPNFTTAKTTKTMTPEVAAPDIEQASNKTAPKPKPVQAPKTVAVLPIIPQVETKDVEDASASSSVEQPGFKVISKKSGATPALADPVKGATGTAPKPAAVKGSYAVSSGDSLYTIAKAQGTTVAALKAANGLTDGKLKIGQNLKIPQAGAVAAKIPDGVDTADTATAKVAAKQPVITTKAPLAAKVLGAAKAIDETETAAIKPAPSSSVIEEAEKDTTAAPGSTGISKLRWPVRGRTLSGYGQAVGGKVNDGIDISVPNGTPVKSAENGVVIYAGTGLKDFGNTVLVRHDNGLVTVYGNNGNISVKRGQTVKRGQELAKSGMSGNTKVPKLHFEVRKDSAPINPAGFLE